MSPIDQAAREAGERHAAFLEGLRGIIAQVTAIPSAERQRRAAYAKVSFLAQTVHKENLRRMEADLLAACVAGCAAVGHDGALPGYVHDRAAMLSEDAEATLRLQMERDGNTALRAITDQALRERLKGTQRPDLIFQHLDRAARRWPAQHYIATFWRGLLVTGMVESSLIVAMATGHDELAVHHPEPGHAHAGLTFHLDRDDWDEFRDRVFHPNSRASLVPKGGEA